MKTRISIIHLYSVCLPEKEYDKEKKNNEN